LIRNGKPSSHICRQIASVVTTTVWLSSGIYGVLRFEDAAKFAGCKIVESYHFDPSFFRGYSHINTLDAESAIKDQKRFATSVFMKDG